MTGESEIIITKGLAGLAHAGADLLLNETENLLKKDPIAPIAISGGSTPRSMHQLLANEPYLSKIPWKKLHVFWVDERCVLEEDEASNFGTARRDLFDKVPIPVKNIHSMPGYAHHEQGAEKYEDELKAFFKLDGDGWPVFDLVFLGIGTDGHTASLFPGHKALEESDRRVVAVKGGNPDVYRLTLTLPVINRARKIVFLASGKGKAEIVKRIFHERETRLPAQMVRPVSGKLIWLMDEDAASLLEREKK